jgi:hypothetical protein
MRCPFRSDRQPPSQNIDIPSHRGTFSSWLKTKNWWRASSSCSAPSETQTVSLALLASDRDGQLEFVGSAILNPPRQDRAKWSELMAAFAVAQPPVRGLRQDSAQWLRSELWVRVRHLKAKGTLRHATVKQLIAD